MKFLRKLSLVVISFSMVLAPVNSVFAEPASDNLVGALPENLLNFYAENNILFYDPTGCVPTTGSVIPSSPEAAATQSSGSLAGNQVAFVERYHDIAVKLSINYGIPWEAVMAQGILESASGTSEYATKRNNFFGLGAVDSNPDNAFSYASPEAGWKGYYDFIANNSRYRQHGAFSGDAVTDPYTYIKAIKAAGYATAPNYVSAVSNVIKEVEALAKKNNWESSAQLAKKYPEWKENAAKNSKGGGNGDGVPNTGDNGISSLSSSQVEFCSGNGELVSGGMTLEQARAFMENYRNLAIQYRYSYDAMVNGVYYKKFCTDGPFANCSAFSRWFVATYTDAGDTTQTNGGVYASSLGSRGFQTGNVPRPYAIFSSSGITSAGHTGVILGVDEERGVVVIGEANCGSGIDGIKVREASISSVTGYTYAYTDGRLSGV